MLCPECGKANHIVVDTTRKSGNGNGYIERVRKCLSCGFPWLTKERIERSAGNGKKRKA